MRMQFFCDPLCFLPDVTAVLLSDVIFFLQETSQKYVFAAFDNKVRGREREKKLYINVFE